MLIPIVAFRSGMLLVLLGALAPAVEAQSVGAGEQQQAAALTLEDAIARASANEPAFAAAKAETPDIRA